MTKKIIRVSNLIEENEIKSWAKDEVVTIEAGTDTGKSYFIKNGLYDYAKKNGKKILFLVHRTNCDDQFQNEIEKDGKTDVITIATYQKIETIISDNRKFDFSQYDYICCDENHYFFDDSTFNKTTDVSLNAILNETNAVRIFMSATSEMINKYINNVMKVKTKSYKIDKDFSFIEAITFFKNDSSVEQYIEDCLLTDEKMIVFIQSVKKAYKLHKKYKKHSLFNCGKSSVEYKHVNEEKVHDMLFTERFEKQILITTTAMDSGVNIIDKKVKHVIADIEDLNVLEQCLGRRRTDKLDENDTVHIYIKEIVTDRLVGRISQTRQAIEKADFFRKNGEVKYVEEYGRNPDNRAIVFDTLDENNKPKKAVNELTLVKSKINIVNMQEMKAKGYRKVVAEHFEQSNYRVEIETKEEKDLVKYLEDNVGVTMLSVADRKDLIEKINIRNGNNNKLLRSIEILNARLEETSMAYRIVEYRVTKTVNGKKKNYKSAWKLVRSEVNLKSITEVVANNVTNSIETKTNEYGLEIGQKYKYKELCEIFGEDTKTGNSKISQMKQWEDIIRVESRPKANFEIIEICQ